MNRLILTLCAALIAATAGAENMGIHGANNTALPNIGKVIEIANVAGYTYLHVEGKEGKEWIAGKAAELKEGDVVRYSTGSIMRNFFSKSLNKTFPEIRFTSAIQLEGVHPTPASTAAPSPTAAEGTPTEQANIVESQVISAMDSGGYTYIEIDQNGKAVWLAAPKTTVKKGDTIRYANDGATMKNFYSKSLNREFSALLFIGEAQVIQQP